MSPGIIAAANNVPTDWLVMSASRIRIRLGGMIWPSVPDAQIVPHAKSLVVAAPQHAGQREQTERHHGGADDARGRAHQHADQDDADAEPAAQRAGDMADHVHEVFGESGAFQHHAHEHEQRDREQRRVRDHAEDATRQQIEQQRTEAEQPNTKPDVASVSATGTPASSRTKNDSSIRTASTSTGIIGARS